MHDVDWRKSVWTYVAFTGVAFGCNGLLSKALIDDGVDAFAVTSFPFLLAGALAIVGALRRHGLQGRAVPVALLLGLVGSATPALLFNIGFETLPAGIVTLLISLGPAVTAVVSHFVFDDERFNRTKGVGLVLAVTGVAVLASATIGGGASPRGVLVVLVGSTVGGAAGVLTRRSVMTYGVMPIVGLQMFTGGTIALLLGGLLGRLDVPTANGGGWHWPALIIIGVSNALAFTSMLRANTLGTTGQVSVIGYFLPLFGVVGGALLFGDAVGPSVVVGGCMILVAMGVIARGSARQPVLPATALV